MTGVGESDVPAGADDGGLGIFGRYLTLWVALANRTRHLFPEGTRA